MLIEGKTIKQKSDAFKKPISSSLIGIHKVGLPFGAKKTDCIDYITEKCLIFSVETRRNTVTLIMICGRIQAMLPTNYVYTENCTCMGNICMFRSIILNRNG